jgi:hypothetical protein
MKSRVVQEFFAGLVQEAGYRIGDGFFPHHPC